MEYDFSTLSILAEVSIAFVALSAIVSSIRVTFGENLSSFQRLLVQFFTVTGLFAVTNNLLPMVLWQFWQNELVVATYCCWYMLTVIFGYLCFYVRQRIQIKAPTPLPSLFVMIGYGICIAVLVLSVADIYWEPSLAIITALSFWALCSTAVIFVYFLSTFIDHQ